jgi:hypothetical protein
MFSERELGVGGVFHEQIREELTRAELGVVVLDPYALRSTWLAFETGFVSAKAPSDTRPKLFPLVLVPDPSLLVKTPFGLLNCAGFTPAGLKRLFQGILDALPPSPDARPMMIGDLTTAAEGCFAEISHALDAVNSSAKGSLSGLLSLIETVATEHADFGLVPQHTATELAHLLRASRSEYLEGVHATTVWLELSEIARHFAECSAPDTGRFGEIASEWALRHLIRDARLRLRSITQGELSFFHHPVVRDFWRSSVFGKAQQSIWTTYIDKPGYTMGGEHKRPLLDAQKAAVDAGVVVTRVFVHPTAMGQAEILERRSLMRAQLDAGVRVLVLTEADFSRNTGAHDWVAAIGSPDFMIIDDCMLYLSYPREDGKVEAALIDGRLQPERLEAARRFKLELESCATEITADTIDRFGADSPA